ncbi:MAG: 30S ribosomal protein S2 [Hyphomicrobiales bacterium]|nr:30S ribosomal protein S2 [Hyphomicrobiales bacterium]
MAIPDFTMRELLDAGVHFGHQRHRWNPKMEPYLFGVRNNVHIIDLTHTMPLLHRALAVARETTREGGRILFVGTKTAAGKPLSEAAQACAQYYIDYRWLGGTLTNWQTISNSIKRLGHLEDVLAEEEASGLSKKERLKLTRERNKLNRALGGIKGMGDLPDLMFVIDTNKESIAVREAQQLGIPVMAVLDSNSNPDDIAYPIPGNDDGARAILLYCKLISAAALDGVSEYQENAAFEADEADNAEALVEAAEEGTPAKENASAEVETPAEAASEDPEAKPEESKTEPEETP